MVRTPRMWRRICVRGIGKSFFKEMWVKKSESRSEWHSVAIPPSTASCWKLATHLQTDYIKSSSDILRASTGVKHVSKRLFVQISGGQL